MIVIHVHDVHVSIVWIQNIVLLEVIHKHNNSHKQNLVLSPFLKIYIYTRFNNPREKLGATFNILILYTFS